jgi:hypothetical protein
MKWTLLLAAALSLFSPLCGAQLPPGAQAYRHSVDYWDAYANWR